jgi:steroid 5-alpha reductase family enzyme
MPRDVKAMLSAVTLIVAVAYAYWERASGRVDLFWFVIAFGIFAVLAMWVFPEATAGKPRNSQQKD